MLVNEPDLEWEFIDGSYVKTHQHSAGAGSGETEAIGKSRAGNTTKIHLAVDAYGLPIEFVITGGEVNDCTAAPELMPSCLMLKRTKATTVSGYASRLRRKGARPSSREGATPLRAMPTWTEACIDTGIW